MGFRYISVPFIILITTVHFSSSLRAQDQSRQVSSTVASNAHTARIWENKGQVRNIDGVVRNDVKYLLEGNGVNIQLKSDGFSYDLISEVHSSVRIGKARKRLQSNRLDIHFLESGRNPEIVAYNQSKDYRNFYYDGISVEGVHSYETIVYKDVYPNVDFVFHASVPAQRNSQKLTGFKYDIVVRPGGKLTDVKLKIGGADNLSLNSAGTLEMTAGKSTLLEEIPLSYIGEQHGFAKQAAVQCNYKLEGNILQFEAASVPNGYTLVVDPQLVWGTYYGGSSADRIYEVCRAGANTFVMTGRTDSYYGIATAGASQTTWAGGDDGFVMKFDTDGQCLWASYFGGGEKEAAHTITVDRNGNILVGGETETATGLATAGVTQRSTGGGRDGFLVKFDPAGLKLWCTYLGGSFTEEVFGVAATQSGTIVVTGRTESPNFPVTAGAVQSTHGGGDDCFVTGLSEDGVRLWSTYLGGYSAERGLTIAELPDGSVVVAGETSSPTKISTQNSFQPSIGGGADGFVAKFSSTGALSWSTYYGGSGNEVIRDIAVDSIGTIVFTGGTYSTSGIATQGTFRPSIGGSQDAMVVAFNAQGQRLWGTYFGGQGFDQGYGIDIKNETVYVSGETYSAQGIASVGALNENLSGQTDCFFATFDPHGLLYCATYYGGNGGETATDVIGLTQVEGIIFGSTNSNDGISTPGGFLPAYQGGIDMFLARIINTCQTQMPLIIAYPDVAVCRGDSVMLEGSVTGGEPPYTYLWSPATGLSSVSSEKPMAFPDATTKYFVTISDRNGVIGNDSVLVTVAGVHASVNVRILDVTANPGEKIKIKVVVTGVTDYSTLASVPYSGVLTCNKTVIDPLTYSYQDIGEERRISFNGVFSGYDSIVIELRVMTLLGEVDLTSLHLDEFVWGAACIQSAVQDGTLRLRVCEEGGKRLLYTNEEYIQSANYPNPFSESTTIKYSVKRDTHLRLSVIDLFGRELEVLADGFHPKGDYSAVYNARSRDSAVLYYVIETPDIHQMKPLRILN